jgi:acyl-CoA synthetase (AMP-forming)/AMP-acid ligase II
VKQRVGDRLSELFTRWAEEQAVEFVPLADPNQRVWSTWGDLGSVRLALASILAERDVPARCALAIVVRQRPALVAAELAALADGRTALLVASLQADRALAAEIEAIRAAVLVAHTSDWERPWFDQAIVASGALGIEVDDDFHVRVRHPVESVQPGPSFHAAVTVSTSGTTGPAKRLPVAWETFARLGGGPDGRQPRSGKGALILSLPLTTLGGLLSMARLVYMGRPMAMMERFDVRVWAALVKEHGSKVIGAPPPVVQMILDADISPDHFEGVTAYMTSSAAIPADTIRRFEQRYGIPVLLGYGATEFLNSVSGWTPELWERFGAAKVGSVGRALPGVRLRVVEPASLDAPQPIELTVGEEGILEVDPPQRAENLPNGWLRTNDRARVDADGFLWILGRADDVIVRGGFKVDLAMVERALVEHPAVERACVVGLPDDRLGQVPGAAVEFESGASATPDALIEWLRQRVPPYAVPIVVQPVDAIPQTSTFKPHRAEVERLLLQQRVPE